jgi:hypothetical protein
VATAFLLLDAALSTCLQIRSRRRLDSLIKDRSEAEASDRQLQIDLFWAQVTTATARLDFADFQGTVTVGTVPWKSALIRAA